MPYTKNPPARLICPNCQTSFARTGPKSIFCCSDCGEAHRNKNRHRNKISHPQTNAFSFYGRKLEQKKEKDVAVFLLSELCNAVDAIGGVRKVGDEFVLTFATNKPKIVAAYISACKVLNRKMKIVDVLSDCPDCGMLMESATCIYCHPKTPIVDKCSVFMFSGNSWKEAS